MTLSRRGLLAGLFGATAAALVPKRAYAFFDPVSMPRNSLRLLGGELGTRYGVDFFEEGHGFEVGQLLARGEDGLWRSALGDLPDGVLRNRAAPLSFTLEPPTHLNCRCTATLESLAASAERASRALGELAQGHRRAARGTVEFTGSLELFYPGQELEVRGLSSHPGPMRALVTGVETDFGEGRTRLELRGSEEPDWLRRQRGEG